MPQGLAGSRRFEQKAAKEQEATMPRIQAKVILAKCPNVRSRSAASFRRKLVKQLVAERGVGIGGETPAKGALPCGAFFLRKRADYAEHVAQLLCGHGIQKADGFVLTRNGKKRNHRASICL